jgi:hypothetical protein
MISRLIPFMILGLLLGIWEIIFYPFLPAWLAWRPLLPAVVIVLIAMGRRQAYAVGLAGAFLLDVYSIASVEMATLRFFLVVLLLDTILQQWLTNRSLYATLGLLLIGRGLERAMGWILNAISRLFGLTAYGWVHGSHEWAALGWDVVLAGIGFLVFFLLTRRSAAAGRQWEQTEFYGTR